ncbi:MAG: SpoIIE family protein phosphatase [Phycisphaerae bacterium]
MRIVVIQGETSFVDQHFSGGTIYIGRHGQCQIKLPGDEHVANRHMMIHEENGQWFVAPVHDQFHTSYLNGHLLQKTEDLLDGDELRVGNFLVQCYTEEETAKKTVSFQVIPRSNSDLQAVANLSFTEMHLPESVIIKHRTDTFSLSKGRMEYVSGLALRMLDMPDVRSLLSMVIETVMLDFKACCAWAGLRSDAEGHLVLSVGKDLSGRPIDPPPTAQKFAFATVECACALLQPALGNNPDRSCLACPLISPDGSLGMIYLESDPKNSPYNVADLDTLVFVCNQMALAIDLLLRRERDQMDHIRVLDQELARKVQARTAPWKLPQWPELHMAVLSEPGTQACSDFYDLLPLGDKQGMVLIGQTTTDSSDAAVCIAEMSAAFRIGAVHRDEPQVLMRQVNWLMHATAGEPRRISAGVLMIDPQSGEFCICLAGNIHAYLIADNGKIVKIKYGHNPLVGKSRKSKYEAVKGTLIEQQTLALCTDGIFSVTSDKDEPFDEKHLLDLLSDSFGQIPARILSDLADDISAFTGGKKASNDITLLLLQKGRPIA